MAELIQQRTVVPIKPVAEPPPEMGLDDRRIVFAKLSDVYIDSTTGYTAGWNDGAVAKDLNIPRAWVESVRNEFFGPAKSNDETNKLLKDADAAVAEAKRINADAQAMLLKATDILNQARALTQHTVPLERKVTELKKVMGV